MTNREAVDVLKANYPDAYYEDLTEAVDLAVSALGADSDCISRKAAIDALMDEFKRVPTTAIRAKNQIEDLPSAEPERKAGKWINAYPDIEPNPMFMYGICSVCGFEQAISNKLNFCPNCGADMRGEQDE